MARTKAHRSVFEDLGFSPEQAENLRVRSELALMIRRQIEALQLSQTAAAARFGVTQPRLSDLLRGRIHLFRIDALVSMLVRAGVSVTFVRVPLFPEATAASRSSTEAPAAFVGLTDSAGFLQDFSRPVDTRLSTNDGGAYAAATSVLALAA